MNIQYNRNSALQSIVIYCSGDAVAAFLTNSVSFSRTAGIALIAVTFYTVEIPNVFRWIEDKTKTLDSVSASIQKTLYATAYFNPLWIARHLFFVQLFSGNYHALTLNLVVIGTKSFLVNIPISVLANYLIQNYIPLKMRFLVSSLFSAAMAVYYAMSQVWFS